MCQYGGSPDDKLMNLLSISHREDIGKRKLARIAQS